MHDAGVDACDPHALDGICEAAELQVEVERLGAVGRGEMRERADLVERTVEGDLAGEFDGLVVAHADAVHAGIERQMVRRAHPVRIGELRIGDGEFGRVDGRHDVVLKQERRGGGGRLR